MKIKIKSFWPAILSFIIATILFCLPGQEFPQEEWFGKVLLDKWIHVGLFAVLVTFWCLPFILKINDEVKIRAVFTKITLGFIAYGIGIEFIQGHFIPFRTFGIDDMIADAIGCGVGLLFAKHQLKNQKLPN
jgi:VanZ family protein